MTSRNESSSINLPTREDVLGWKEALDRLKVEESEMKARHAAEEKAIRNHRAKLDKLVEYGMQLVDLDALPTEPTLVPELAPDPAPNLHEEKPAPTAIRMHRGRGKTWTATIKKAVIDGDRPMTYSEVKEAIGETHLGETLRRTDKAFYGGLSKLSGKGEIIKHRGHMFSPKAYQRFMDDVNAGRIEDFPDSPFSSSGPSPNEIAVERFLARRPGGATTVEIVNDLLTNPPEDLEVTTNRTSIYNLLNRHWRSGKLIRHGDRYSLPSAKNKAPDSEEPSALESGGADTPPFDG